MRATHDRSRGTIYLLSGIAVLVVGALESWYGRPQLFGDDIAYLDVANMIHLGNWRAALNPLWSLGYPLLLALTKPLFASSIRGELAAVSALNVAIYLASWISFLWFLETASAFFGTSSDIDRSGGRPLPNLVVIAAACAFVTGQVCLGRVSSVGPDGLVTCLFFVASALVLRCATRPSPRDAALLGLTLGLGYVVKAVFLPLSLIMLAVALLRRGIPRGAAAPAMLLLVAIPYAAALSWAFGRVTLGEAAPLNYAFHVNQLPHWMGWQGGPERLGVPVHPVALLREHPAVFAFGEPFHVTYPPQYDLPYWYDGYRHFFSPANAVRAILTNLHELAKVAHENWPFALGLLLSVATLLYAAPRPTRLGVWKAWPVWLPSILGVVLYLQVHLEGRYIAAFVTILATIPFFAGRWLRPRMAGVALAILVIGAGANLYRQLRPAVQLAIHRADPQSGGQWTIAQYLTEAGLKPGDRVASVTTLNDIRCTWAYAARLHIVADIGNDAYDPGLQQQDFQLFWTNPGIQADVLRLFREQGAVAVVVPHAGTPPVGSGWRPIPLSDAWLLRF